MLMAPAGVDGFEEVSRCASQLLEAKEVVKRVAGLSGEEKTKALRLAKDLMARVSTQLDCLELVGRQRERRRELLEEMELLERELES